MFIPNNLLTKLTMQDMLIANSVRAAKPFFNTSFDTKNIANFYAMGSNSLLTCHHFKKHKNSNIKDNTSQPPDDLALGQK